ncbi:MULTISPECIES: MerR family transcriptional regulator [unclassified Paenibacillus]|uniref:MerR family transcriptional regulator n=1 Tax=Paenibacillus sp. RU4X TaxID=1907395 RepID=UPI00228607A5|nr:MULTISPECIES: MerR family transcriptional regulator [unclassified Paenibacillus]
MEDVANLCGLTKRTVRYYEEIGLLAPERSEGGFRLYTESDVEKLKKIINARDALGFSLQELQEYVSIGEELSVLRDGIRIVEDIERKRSMIGDMEKTVEKQLKMMDQKIAKIVKIRSEFIELKDKIQEAKIRYEIE